MANRRYTSHETTKVGPNLPAPSPGVKGGSIPGSSPTTKAWSNQGGGSKRMADGSFKDVKMYPAGNIPGAK